MPIFNPRNSSKPNSLSNFLAKVLSLDHHRRQGGNIEDDWEFILDRELSSSEEDENLPIKGDETDVMSEDGFSNFHSFPPFHHLKAKYTTMSRAEVRQHLEDKITAVSTILSLSRNDASILLQHFKWDIDRTTDEWLTCEKKVREAVGLFVRPVVETPATAATHHIVCLMCRIGFPAVSMLSVSCGHQICFYCWEGYIREAINDGPRCLTLRCPEQFCDAAVGPLFVEFVSSNDFKKQFERHLLTSFLSACHQGKWCPAPDCDRAVFCSYGEEGDVTCQCLHRFCWSCSNEGHAPVDCGTFDKWLAETIYQSENWLLENTTACPKCTCAIERSAGFQFVLCSVCKHQYCSDCGDDWLNGDISDFTHTCKADKFLRSITKQSLEKYSRYYLGWSTCEANRANAFTDLRTLKELQLGLLCNVFGITSKDLDFAVDALQQVIECWQYLKWTHVYAYYMPEDEVAKKNLFDFMQDYATSLVDRLQKLVGELQNSIEGDCPSAQYLECGRRIIMLTRVVKNYFDHMIEGLESGLPEVVSIPPFNPRQTMSPVGGCSQNREAASIPWSQGARVKDEPEISSPVSNADSDDRWCKLNNPVFMSGVERKW